MRLITEENIEAVLKAMELSDMAYRLYEEIEEAEEITAIAEARVDKAITEATNGEVDACLAKDIIRHPREWNDDWSSAVALAWKRYQIKRTLENL